MATHKLTMADDAYVQAQKHIELISGLLLDPKCLGAPVLDLFIERADRSLALGPVLHPSEFRAGADKLQEVLGCARALRKAATSIEAVTGFSLPQSKQEGSGCPCDPSGSDGAQCPDPTTGRVLCDTQSVPAPDSPSRRGKAAA